MPDQDARGEMPFLDHLEELRWRLLYSLGAIVLGTVIGWFVGQHVDVLELLKRPIAPYIPGGRLVFTSPAEPFLLTLKIAFAVGLVLASPVVVYQLWSFLAPALYQRERRIIVPSLVVGLVLFAAGAAAAYFYALPAALRVLFGFQRADLAPVITIDRYFGFAIPFILAFGAITELPLVVTILSALGVITPRILIKYRRWAIMIGAIAAAFLSPPDALSMMMMLVPILLLYEVSILCSWVVARRRARRQAASGATLVALVALGLCGAGRPASAQQPVPPPVPAPAAKPGAPPAPPRPGQPVDTATARRLGLPTGPSRSLPPADSVLDSLIRLKGFQVTRYMSDTLLVRGDSQTINLRGTAFVERGGTQLEAEWIRFHEASCRLDARGEPKLFENGQVMTGVGMRYDTCVSRGVVTDAVTNFEQEGVRWFMRGDLAMDSNSTRMYGSSSEVTSCDLPEPSYHFAAREVKWLNKNVMVARPAVLYVRDVPVLWLPFMFNDIRPGRHSGVLVPKFGLNDLVRTSRSWKRHINDVGYFWAINDYSSLIVSSDWTDDRSISAQASAQYAWLNRFITGGVSYRFWDQLDQKSLSHQFAWSHQQRFDSRTTLSANINYASNRAPIQNNSIDPTIVLATLASQLNFSKRFAWGSFSAGGSRTQQLSNDLVTQTFPTVSLQPSPVNIGDAITWSPSFGLTTTRTLNNGPRLLLVPGDTAPDTLRQSFDTRHTQLDAQTPLRVGRWNWSNSFTVLDDVSTNPLEVVDSSGQHTIYGRPFSSEIDWSTGINLPGLFSGTWKLQPSVQIVNRTGAGRFLLRNQYTGGRFVSQGKRMQFSLGMTPTFFGFFPGLGPLARIRHALSPIVSYQYAPGSRVPDDYVRAVDPTGKSANARTDPQQTITIGLSQNIEAKLKPPAGDTASQGRKIRLLSINTSSVSYNFEAAKQPGRSGWQTDILTNTLGSDLIPGFDVTVTHDLFDHGVGFDSSTFDPFLSGMSARFALTPNTFRSIAGLFGLRRRAAAAPPPAAPPIPGQGVPPPPPMGPLPSDPVYGRRGRFPGAAASGFSLNVDYTLTRTREGAAAGVPGQHQMNLRMSFNPTPKWSAVWNTTYDFATGQFGQHDLSFRRDLRRWEADFTFQKSANGNFAFSFRISLRDQPDIKFDYDQTTYVQ